MLGGTLVSVSFDDAAYSFCHRRIPMHSRSHCAGDAPHIQTPLELHGAYLPALHSSHHLHGPGMLLTDPGIFILSSE